MELADSDTFIVFMQKFTFVPNQRLNFLCGENGSGKSAVLTAIVFALGGTARTSCRGTTNKAFIRTNQTSATVEIALTNVGEHSYRPGTVKCGNSVTFSRLNLNFLLKTYRCGLLFFHRKVALGRGLDVGKTSI